MDKHYPVKTLLRPANEWVSSFCAMSVGTAFLVVPELLALPTDVARGFSVPLLGLACYRGQQAWRIIRYAKNLNRLPEYRLRSEQIPISTNSLFLGQGFLWTQEHTQRLAEARSQQKPLNKPSKRRESATGGDPSIHGVGNTHEQPVTMPLAERVGHTGVIARTRQGKTRLAEILITQDIHRDKNNCVIVLDPKGDADLMRRVVIEAQKAGRELIVLHLGYPDCSARYNPIGRFSRLTEAASRIASALPGEGDAQAFRDFAWQYVNTINCALYALGERPDFVKIRRYISDIDPLFVRYAEHYFKTNHTKHWKEKLKNLIQQVQTEANKKRDAKREGRDNKATAIARYLQDLEYFDPILEGLSAAFRFEREYFQKITAAVKPLLEKLTSGAVSELLTPNFSDLDDHRPTLDWLGAIRQNAVVYVGLDAMSDPEIAAAFGQAAFSDLTSLAGYLYKHGAYEGLPDLDKQSKKNNIIIHADEFSDLIGPQFKTLINKAGGAGFQLTLYTQTWSDVIAELGSVAKAGQLAGNIGTLIMMSVKEISTAEMLIRQLPEVPVKHLTPHSSVSDASDVSQGFTFHSQNQDKLTEKTQSLINAADVVALPKGQAFALLNGSELWKIRIPLPCNDNGSKNSQEIDALNALLSFQSKYRPPIVPPNTSKSTQENTGLRVSKTANRAQRDNNKKAQSNGGRRA